MVHNRITSYLLLILIKVLTTQAYIYLKNVIYLHTITCIIRFVRDTSENVLWNFSYSTVPIQQKYRYNYKLKFNIYLLFSSICTLYLLQYSLKYFVMSALGQNAKDKIEKKSHSLLLWSYYSSGAWVMIAFLKVYACTRWTISGNASVAKKSFQK